MEMLCGGGVSNCKNLVLTRAEDKYGLLLEALSKSGVDYSTDVDLSSFTYMRTGGRAAVVLFPSTKNQLSECIRHLTMANMAFKVIGNTSNLLFLDDARYTCLLCTTKLDKLEYNSSSGEITAETGVMVPSLARYALANERTGMEGLEGIPGTLGGAIYMNAGAYGSEIKDYLVAVEVVDSSGNFTLMTKDEISLTHRSSALRKGGQEAVVYACRFRLPGGVEREIFSRMELFHAKRHRYQDFMYPNLGSIFSGSPYRALSKRDKLFGLVTRLHIFLGYKLKVLGRESPINRRWLNDFAARRFGWDYAVQPYSDKTLNCLVNRGQGTAEMVRYIRALVELSPGVPLENEIVEPF